MDVCFVYLYASILSKFNVIILNAEIIFMTSKAFRLKYLRFHFKCSNLGKKKADNTIRNEKGLLFSNGILL